MKRFCLEVRGDFACFTRPEMKVERVSYDIITPSSARSIFEAVLWKPQMRWHVRQIDVLQPVRWVNLRRNEVGAVVAMGAVKSAMNSGTGNLGLYIEDKIRQQRAALFLRDVAYRLHADLEVLPDSANHNPPAKYQEMFVRRALKGQCVNQPYLGCREFSCSFRLIEHLDAEPPAIRQSADLGYMLHDLDFSNPIEPMPRFYRAKMENGVVLVPDFHGEEVVA